jgi:hypothetical protein
VFSQSAAIWINCWWEIKCYKDMTVFSGKNYIPNLIKIHTVELMLVVMAAGVVVWADRQTCTNLPLFTK